MGKKKKKEQVVSLKPSDASEGGGYFEGTITVTRAYFGENDYGGTQAPVPALFLEGEDQNGGEHQKAWSCGDAQSWRPSDDGKGLVALSDKSTPVKSCFFMRLMDSIIQAGFDEDDIEGDITALEGLTAEFAAVKQSFGGSLGDKNVVLCTNIISLPGEDDEEEDEEDEEEDDEEDPDEEEEKPKKKDKKKKASKKAASPDKKKKKGKKKFDVEAATEDIVKVLLERNDGELSSSKMTTLIWEVLDDEEDELYDKHGGDAHANDIVTQFADVDFLDEKSRPWKRKGKKLKLKD